MNISEIRDICEGKFMISQDTNSNICQLCGSEKRDPKKQCENCLSMEINYHPESSKVQDPDELIQKKIKYFKQRLDKLDMSILPDNPETLIAKISSELDRSNIRKIDNSILKEIMKKIGLQKYYDYRTYIRCRLLKIVLPDILTYEDKDIAIGRFVEVLNAWFIISEDPDKSFISYPFCMKKIFELLDTKKFDLYLPLLDLDCSDANLEKNMYIWKKICNYLQWQYIE